MRLEYAFLKVERSPVFAASRTASRGAACGTRVSCADAPSATSSAAGQRHILKAEQIAPPLRQGEDEQHQHEHDDDASDCRDASVEAAELLLPRDRALLQLQRALGHAAVFGEPLAPHVPHLAQQPAAPVVAHWL